MNVIISSETSATSILNTQSKSLEDVSSEPQHHVTLKPLTYHRYAQLFIYNFLQIPHTF